MTSTGINVGLTDERNSSRVLRPPGGGHSDIFGTRDIDNGIVTPSKRRNQPQSTIGGCFNMVEEAKEKLSSPKAEKEEIATNGIEAQNGQKNNEVDNETDENKAPSEQEEKKKQEQNPIPKRVRVPPGGFSSALW